MSAILDKIEGILTDSFSIQNYLNLMSEILDGMQVVAPNNLRKDFPTNFAAHIVGYYHVGTYQTPEKNRVIVMAVELKKQLYVENSRSTQRSLAKKLIESASADAALVAFFTEGDPRWRLSFVRLDYEMKIEGGRLKTAENITPARRYSFLVGKDEPCHTAIERFRLFLENRITNPTLDDLESAFSVEAVTKEFFELYCEKFLQLRDCLEKNADFVEEAKLHNYTSAQFAKKLMGQIVFLYFLQKKGWLGVSAWPRELNAADYKSAFFRRGSKSRELIPVVYSKVDENTYRINASALSRLSDEDETFLSTCVKGEPWGSGPHNFMRRLFETSEKRNANFFDDFLEPLFYDALNVNRGEQGYDPALHCRIPFLSGGLFEPIDGYDWKHNNFDIPNELFSNKKDHKDRLADGILDIFDRYNFTMSEDEPLEREVAIDPEMLGKVFENLLDVNDRKSKGAFYTPREIVHYMCQESLINYLTSAMQVSEMAIRDFIINGDFMKDEDASVLRRAEKGDSYDLWVSEELYQLNPDGTIKVDRMAEFDKALQDVRIADPAVGSGAFPLGMLNEIVRARQNITTYMDITQKIIDPKGASREIRYRRLNDRSAHSLKYETIRNCIFAVDIEPSAVDIAQLRLWLALVIDDQIDPDAVSALDGHRNPLPLPNLECNILCGNSLIDEFEGIKLINESDIIGTAGDVMQMNLYQSAFDAMLKRLIEKQDALFRCDDTAKKAQLLQDIEALRDDVIMSQLRGATSDQLDRYNETKDMASKPFVLWQLDFARVFREKGGFDIVIGNPPYVGEKGNKEIFRPIAATAFGEKYYLGKMDFFYFFFHKAIDIGNRNAEIGFITTNYYPTAFGAKKLRVDFCERTQIRRLINLNEMKVFESAQGQHNMITLLTKQKSSKIIARNCLCKISGLATQKQLKEVLYSITDTNFFSIYYVEQEDLYEGEEYYIRLTGCGVGTGNAINGVYAKLASGCHLKDIAIIKQGIVSGADKYTDAHQTKYHLNIPKGKGIFILRKEELAQLAIPANEIKYVKKVYKNSQISKYHIDYNDELYVLYMTKHVSEADAPHIIGYLEEFKPILSSKRETIEGKMPWYSLNWARDEALFESPEKIVNSRRSIGNVFALETKQYYEQSDIMITVIKDQYREMYPTKYVLGLLNSKVYYAWLHGKGKVKGKMLELYGTPLEEIPIIQASKEAQAEICTYVDELLSMDNSSYEAFSSRLDAIDKVVYRIFDLSEEEISAVEDECKLQEGE